MSSQLNSPLGIFGGTFDPIHYGHLSPCLECLEQLKLAEIRFIPSHTPVHRDQPRASIDLRLAMISKAIADEPRFVLDKREIEREGRSYMMDTLLSLRSDFPNSPLCLILGMDAFFHIHTWYRWQELLEVCHFIVTKRPETHFDSQQQWPDELKSLYKNHYVQEIDQIHRHLYGKIVFQNVTQLDISSSSIRSKLKQQHSVRFLLPDPVLDIITNNRLYL